MSDFIKRINDKARKNPKKIAFPESTEPRTLKAIEVIEKEKTAVPILVGNKKETEEAIKKLGVKIKSQIVDVDSSKNFEKYAKELFRLRKDRGVSLEQAKESMKEPIYFATMMLHFGEVDGVISGAVHPTAHTLRPALQIIRTKREFQKVSGVFFIKYHDEIKLFADAAVEISPDAKDLADIAIDTAHTAKEFGIEPRVAMLSFSTKGSASHPEVDKVKEAVKIAQHKKPKLLIDGELQLDAAVMPEVCKIKCPDCKLQGNANVFIFPNLSAANIGYKLVMFFGKAEAIGPVIQGLNKPVNDLSRSCTTQDIVDITAVTVIQAQKTKK